MNARPKVKTYDEEDVELIIGNKRKNHERNDKHLRGPDEVRAGISGWMVYKMLGTKLDKPSVSRPLGIPEEMLDVSTPGSDWIQCQKCGGLNKYIYKYCGRCLTELHQTIVWHSSVGWQADKMAWNITLGRDTTQFRTYDSKKYPCVWNEIVTEDMWWITYVKVCETIAPIVYWKSAPKLYGLKEPYDPTKFSVAIWRTHTRQHIQWTNVCIKRWIGLVWDMVT